MAHNTLYEHALMSPPSGNDGISNISEFKITVAQIDQYAMIVVRRHN